MFLFWGLFINVLHRCPAISVGFNLAYLWFRLRYGCGCNWLLINCSAYKMSLKLLFSFVEMEKCQIHGECSQLCSVEEDVYKCYCDGGYVLNEDNKTCRAEGEKQ